MEDRPLQSNWLAAGRRFDALKDFVMTSAATRPTGDQEFRENLYCSWVLLTYATTQGAVASQGAACVTILGRAAEKPSDLPPNLRREHQKLTLAFLADYSAGRTSGMTELEFEATLSSLERSDWSHYTRLLTLERNVRPNFIRSWLTRLGSTHKLGWIDSAVGSGSETLGSQIERLVDERNRLAHGDRPMTLLEAELMCDWIDVARLFVERIARTVQEWTIRTFPTLAFPEVGVIDWATSETLGSQTVAFATMATPLQAGELICVWNGTSPTITHVVSMQSDGVSLAAVDAGQERLAITFARAVVGGSRMHCLP